MAPRDDWRIERPPVGEEVHDELEFHVEMRSRELMARGMDPDRARIEARRRLGDLAVMRARLSKLGRERNRTMERKEWISELGQDARYAVRSLLKNPGFAATALLTLAIGIGATTAIFSAVYSVVLRPLPFRDPDRVVVIGERREGQNRPADVAVGNFADLEREQTRFASLGAMYSTNVNLADAANPERVLGARVTADYFSVFGIPPRLGRTFTPEEDRAGGPAVVVLSDRLWRRRFGADPAILGRSITLNAAPHTVVGIMPPEFDVTATSEELWLPAGFTPEQETQHDEHFLTVVGRLRPGASVAEARAEVEGVMARLVERYPEENSGIAGGFVAPMLDEMVGPARDRLLILLGAVGFVLLIGCVNVANLLLARGAAREKELALRAALGAGRGRIIRQLLTESLVLALAAGALGVAIAFAAVPLLVAAAPTSVPRLERAAIDGPALGFALGASLLSALLFGLIPALKVAVPALHPALREGGRGSSAGRREWLRRSLIVVEVAVALVLLFGAGLLVRTAINLGRVDPGFDPTGVESARMTLPATHYATWDAVTEAFGRIVTAARQQPGIKAAGLSSQVPAGPGGNSNGLIPEGRPIEPASVIDARLRLVSPGYLEAMRIPLRSGRDFTDDDRVGRPRVMIVNQAFARIAWPGGENPVGKRVLCCEPDGAMKEVIGVAADVRWRGLAEEATPEFYLPVAQAPKEAWKWLQRTMTLVARGPGDPSGLLAPIRNAVRQVDPTLPIYGITTMEQQLAGSLAEARFNTGLLGLLSVIGLVLASVGIYGVIAYFVARRTRELGIRMALGASAGRIRAMVIRQGLAPVAAGVGLGIVLSFGMARVLTSQLRGVEPNDPVTFAIVAATLVAVAVGASLIPAARATRVDTVTAMREE